MSSIGYLCSKTPAMATALEIGSSAEQYMAEGHYQSALDKFQSCLGVLIPLLSNEPKGRRRDLLHNQIQLWMKQAESTKALLCVDDFKEANIPENKGKYASEESLTFHTPCTILTSNYSNPQMHIKRLKVYT